MDLRGSSEGLLQRSGLEAALTVGLGTAMLIAGFGGMLLLDTASERVMLLCMGVGGGVVFLAHGGLCYAMWMFGKRVHQMNESQDGQPENVRHANTFNALRTFAESRRVRVLLGLGTVSVISASVILSIVLYRRGASEFVATGAVVCGLYVGSYLALMGWAQKYLRALISRIDRLELQFRSESEGH